ncbi:hypothetical protein MMC26_007055 [Xylographa opegraphella]|nr:hypothetical protein [Xylographa opegraphella]
MSSNLSKQLNTRTGSLQSPTGSIKYLNQPAQLASDPSFQQSMERPWLHQRSPPPSPLRTTFPRSNITTGQNPIERWQGQPARDHPWHGAVAVKSQRKLAQLLDRHDDGGNQQPTDLTSTRAQGSGSDIR